MNTNNNRVTPENITQLSDNECFVYGANLRGLHGAGAARLAHQKFGAAKWQYGYNGQSYGIPTKGLEIETLPVCEIEEHVNEFIKFAETKPDTVFLVTAVGTGLADLLHEDIAPMFASTADLPNVYLPQSFRDILNRVTA